MDTALTTLSPAQVHILDMMSFVQTPKAIEDLQQVLSDYFAKQIEHDIDQLWDEGVLTEAKVESFRHLHERTPYK